MDFGKYVKGRQAGTLQRAVSNSDSILASVTSIVDCFCKTEEINNSNICFAVVGSVGRKEALEASDLDIIPVCKDDESLVLYRSKDEKLRDLLRQGLKIKVSRGADLTSPTSVEALVEKDTIGGTKDFSSALTKRILLLTESSQAGGRLDLRDVKKSLLGAYSNEERTSGRHVLTLCNDIARYYKTLCVEYKAKIDEENKDWCSRNLKLRHSRKIWYFSTMGAISELAGHHPTGEDGFREALLDIFDKTPLERLDMAFGSTQPMEVGKLLENYSFFLEFMSKKENRAAIEKVTHESRYDMSLDNPFPAMKFNSDLIHHQLVDILYSASPSMRSRIISWFML